MSTVTANRPPIGAMAMEITPVDSRRRTVYKICAIRGYTVTRAGVLVAPSAKITLQDVNTQERTEMLLCDFFKRYRWEFVS